MKELLYKIVPNVVQHSSMLYSVGLNKQVDVRHLLALQ